MGDCNKKPLVGGVTPSNGSAGGGTQVTVHGGGFPNDVVSVRVCGAPCRGVNVSSDGASLTCVTSPLATVANAEALGVGAVPPEGVDVTSEGYASGSKAGWCNSKLE